MKSTPPPTSNPSTGFGAMRTPGGQAARAPAARGGMAKSTVVGGFSAQELMAQAKAAVPPPVAAAPPPGISREAVLDDVDNEATVMREAPLDVLRQAKASIAPPAGDRKTPVDPTSAAVAAMTAVDPGEAKPAETSMSFGAISLIEDMSEGGPAVEPRETPVSPARGVKAKELVDSAPRATTPSSSGQAPAATPGLATSSLTSPSTSGIAAPVVLPPALAPAPALQAASTPAMAAPAPAPAPPVQQPAAPLAAPAEQQPSALKGLFIGIGLAILILAVAAVGYFTLLKR
jgi:hypothetical protein